MWSAAPDDLWGILDLGFGQVNFTAVIGDVPTYVRCLSVSIDDWTRRLASGLDIPYAIADRLKCAYGILPGSRGVRDLSAGWQSLRAEDLPHVLFGLLRSAVDDLVRDILKCFTYVLNSFPNLNTTRVMLAGGGANLKGLSELLEAQLGLPVAVLALRGNKDSAGWEAPLTDLVFEPESATSVGGALLDLEDL
jgi:cell division ATPase FtsA